MFHNFLRKPNRFFDRACDIAVDRATLHAAGLADCTPRQAEREVEQQQQPSTDTAEDLSDALYQGAAVIDGSMDEISAVKTWHEVMHQYKVSQRCQEELARLDAKENSTERETAAHKRVVAIAKAVTALAALHHKDTRTKLKALMEYERGHKAALAITYSTSSSTITILCFGTPALCGSSHVATAGKKATDPPRFHRGAGLSAC